VVLQVDANVSEKHAVSIFSAGKWKAYIGFDEGTLREIGQ
jgi:hypothetical protein